MRDLPEEDKRHAGIEWNLDVGRFSMALDRNVETACIISKSANECRGVARSSVRDGTE